MTERTARCSCGKLSAQCGGEPILVSLCNCAECRARTGSAFGIAAFFREEDVAIDGQATTYARPSDNGFEVRHGFCPVCGTTLFWRPSRKPGIIAVAAGCFPGPDFPAPTQLAFGDRKAHWLDFSF